MSIGVCKVQTRFRGQLANALDLKSSGQGPTLGHNRVKDRLGLLSSQRLFRFDCQRLSRLCCYAFISHL